MKEIKVILKRLGRVDGRNKTYLFLWKVVFSEVGQHGCMHRSLANTDFTSRWSSPK